MNNSKKQVMEFVEKYRNYLIAILAVIIALIAGLTISNKLINKNKIADNTDSGIVANTKEGIIKEEVYEGLKFSNISLITENGYTTFSADVTNTTDTDNNISDVNIVLKDKNDNAVITLRGNIGDTLKSGETRTITAVTKGNFKSVVTKTIAKYE